MNESQIDIVAVAVQEGVSGLGVGDENGGDENLCGGFDPKVGLVGFEWGGRGGWEEEELGG